MIAFSLLEWFDIKPLNFCLSNNLNRSISLTCRVILTLQLNLKFKYFIEFKKILLVYYRKIHFFVFTYEVKKKNKKK